MHLFQTLPKQLKGIDISGVAKSGPPGSRPGQSVGQVWVQRSTS